MTVELQTVLGSVGLLLVILALQGGLTPIIHGLKWGMGPRDEPRDPSIILGRINRIVANHMEGMMMFVPLILVAHLAGISTPLTVIGAQIFLLGRVAFAVIYSFGVPVLRSASWGIAMAGLFMVAFDVIKAAF